MKTCHPECPGSDRFDISKFYKGMKDLMTRYREGLSQKRAGMEARPYQEDGFHPIPHMWRNK
ncbi:MAG: hypothetical protein C0396_04425 [Anaerolinea sp.]|nr:hypothetical protein [Anaerolinea sp.]